MKMNEIILLLPLLILIVALFGGCFVVEIGSLICIILKLIGFSISVGYGDLFGYFTFFGAIVGAFYFFITSQ